MYGLETAALKAVDNGQSVVSGVVLNDHLEGSKIHAARHRRGTDEAKTSASRPLLLKWLHEEEGFAHFFPGNHYVPAVGVENGLLDAVLSCLENGWESPMPSWTRLRRGRLRAVPGLRKSGFRCSGGHLQATCVERASGIAQVAPAEWVPLVLAKRGERRVTVPPATWCSDASTLKEGQYLWMASEKRYCRGKPAVTTTDVFVTRCRMLFCVVFC